MENKKRLPFQNMTRESWINLAIAATIALYIIQIGFFIFDGTICKNYAFDFCAFWSAGKVSNTHSFVDVYDMTILKEYQKEIYLYTPGENIIFYGCPVPYLPVFLMPFKLLSLLNLPVSYLIWTFVNIIAFILYLRFFTKKISEHPISWRLLLLLFLALPVIVNFQEGQVNIILMIFAGEFIRTFLEDKPTLAGLWLGGWLLKPQLLLLIIPYLLFQKSLKVFLGFCVSSAAILLTSFSLIGFDGFLGLINLIFEYSRGIPTNNIAAMMNWRMFGWHISSISSSTIGWGVTILGTIITLGVTFFFFRRWDGEDQEKTSLVLLGIFAATCAVTWHAHLHMAMILIPLLIYLKTEGEINNKLFFAWVFAPIIIKFIGYIFAIMFHAQNLRMLSFQAQTLTTGLTGLILNLLILGWAVKQYPHSKEQALK